MDSDFDLSEKDEPISDSEDIAEPKPKRRKWLKEIKPKRPPQSEKNLIIISLLSL